MIFSERLTNLCQSDIILIKIRIRKTYKWDTKDFCIRGGKVLPKENLKKKAYDTIKEKIIDCEYIDVYKRQVLSGLLSL